VLKLQQQVKKQSSETEQVAATASLAATASASASAAEVCRLSRWNRAAIARCSLIEE